MTYRILHVKAVRTSEDGCVPGLYAVEVNDDLDDATAASVALDIFHLNVAVEALDDFSFTVMDGNHPMEESVDWESYSGEHLGGDVWICQ